MLGLSITEIMLLAIIALVVIGPKQLPEVARNLGRLLNELKRTSGAFTREFRDGMDQVRIDPIRFDEGPTKKTGTAETTHDLSTVTPATFSTEVMSPQFPLNPSVVEHPTETPTKTEAGPAATTVSGWSPVADAVHAEPIKTDIAKKETGSHD